MASLDNLPIEILLTILNDCSLYNIKCCLLANKNLWFTIYNKDFLLRRFPMHDITFSGKSPKVLNLKLIIRKIKEYDHYKKFLNWQLTATKNINSLYPFNKNIQEFIIKVDLKTLPLIISRDASCYYWTQIQIMLQPNYSNHRFPISEYPNLIYGAKGYMDIVGIKKDVTFIEVLIILDSNDRKIDCYHINEDTNLKDFLLGTLTYPKGIVPNLTLVNVKNPSMIQIKPSQYYEQLFTKYKFI